MDDTPRPLNTNGLDVIEFIEALNRALTVDSDRGAVALLLDQHGDDLPAILEALAQLPVPGHIVLVLADMQPLWKMLIGLARAYTSSAAASIVVVSDGDSAAPITVALADGAVTLTVRQL